MFKFAYSLDGEEEEKQDWSITGECLNNFHPNLEHSPCTDECPHEQIASLACPESLRLLANGSSEQGLICIYETCEKNWHNETRKPDRESEELGAVGTCLTIRDVTKRSLSIHRWTPDGGNQGRKLRGTRLVSVLTGEINVNFGSNLKGLDKVDGIPLLHCAGDVKCLVGGSFKPSKQNLTEINSTPSLQEQRITDFNQTRGFSLRESREKSEELVNCAVAFAPEGYGPEAKSIIADLQDLGKG
ncbi:Choline Transporter-Like Protein 3 [Manis pentadactyla]|nr:Choline Transporter-Like Protein 3 [Manis pentadactyla]